MIAPFVLARVLAALLAMSQLLLLVRLIPPEEFAIYSMLILAGGVVQNTVLVWPSVAVNRFAARADLAGYAPAYGIAIMFVLTSGLALAAALAFALTGGAVRTAILGAAVIAVSFGLHELALSGLRVTRRPVAYFAIETLRPVLTVLLLLVFVAEGGQALAAVLCLGAGSGLVALGGLGLLTLRGRPRLPDRALVVEFFVFGQPLGIVRTIPILINLVTQAAIGRIVGLDAAGHFAAAQALLFRSIVMLMQNIGLSSSAHLFARFEAEGMAGARPVLRGIFLALLVVGLPCALIAALGARQVTTLVFGPGFEPVSVYLPPVALAALATGFQGAYFAFGFSIPKRTLRQLALLALTLLFHVAATFGGIAFFGATGGIWAFTATSIVGAAGYAWAGRRWVVLPGLTKLAFRVLAWLLPGALLLQVTAWAPNAVPPSLALVVGAVAMAMGLAASGLLPTPRALRHMKS